jgi:hypothetical protein
VATRCNAGIKGICYICKEPLNPKKLNIAIAYYGELKFHPKCLFHLARWFNMDYVKEQNTLREIASNLSNQIRKLGP